MHNKHFSRRRFKIQLGHRRRRHRNLEKRLEKTKGIACGQFIRKKQGEFYCVKSNKLCPYVKKEGEKYITSEQVSECEYLIHQS